MIEIDVIGGVYREWCAFPEWDAIYGSAGRAAIAISSHVKAVRLHTIITPESRKRTLPNFESFGIDVIAQDGTQEIGFDYLHCLSDPIIQPAIPSIENHPPFEVNAKIAIVYGMMECHPKISADICIYDPQSPSNPKGFKEIGGTAKRLAILANAREVKNLTGLSGLEGAKALLVEEDAEVVIIKMGLDGVTVVTKNSEETIPAYQTNRFFSIGSGDVFAAAFGYAWGGMEENPRDAAEYASRAVANYLETSSLPMVSIEEAKVCTREVVSIKGGSVYLAGPFRELGQRVLINEARKILKDLGMDVFSPVHDIGRGPAEKVVKLDLEALESCDAVLAILNGSSPGTLFEVGYAVRGNQPVYCVAQNMRNVDLKLPVGSGCIVHNDFVSAMHLLAWRK